MDRQLLGEHLVTTLEHVNPWGPMMLMDQMDDCKISHLETLGDRQPMCDPEGCATVWGGCRWGGRGPPPPPWLTQTLGVGGSGGQPPGPQGGSVGTPNIHTSK